MSKYLWLKSDEQMYKELCQLWDNYDLYKFLKGERWIHYEELEICRCKTNPELHISLFYIDYCLERQI